MRSSFITQRIIMFIIGSIVAFGVFGAGRAIPSIGFFAYWGIAALVVYEVMLRTRKLMRLFTLPVYMILAILIGVPLIAALASLESSGMLPSDFLGIWLDSQTWLMLFTEFPGNVEVVIWAILIVTTAYALLRRPAAHVETTLSLADESEGYGGIEMEPTKSETTRFLCASAVLLGSPFRTSILDQLREKHRAIAPELGIDIGLLSRVCRFLERRETRFQFWFTLVGVAALLLAFVPSAALALIVLLAGGWGLQFYKALEEQYRLPQYFLKSNYDPATVAARFEIALDAGTVAGVSSDEQNLVVYRGFSPFVGAGIDLGGWSFAIDFTRPKESLEHQADVIPFTILELYGRLQERLESLKFSGLYVKDCLFVNGTDIRNDKLILPDKYRRPAQRVSPDTMSRYVADNNSRTRHYKWIRVHDWGNDLILSHFLRCSLIGKNLFVEFNRFLLTPLQSQYRRIDSLPPKRWQNVVASGVGSLVAGPFLAILSWLALLSRGLESLQGLLGSEERRRRSEINNMPLFNYGVVTSIRALLSRPAFVHYFQKSDVEMYVKILEREILDTLIEFLDEHNIDTSELKERQTTILNSGIIVQGGNVEAQTLAVGKGAQATRVEQPSGSPARREARQTRKEG